MPFLSGVFRPIVNKRTERGMPLLADEWVVVHAAEANNRALQRAPLPRAHGHQHHHHHEGPTLFETTRPHHVVLHITCEIAEYLGRNKLLQAMHLMHTSPLGVGGH